MDYVTKIRLMLVNPASTKEKAKCAQSHIKQKHLWSSFTNRLEKLGLLNQVAKTSDENTSGNSSSIVEKVA